MRCPKCRGPLRKKNTPVGIEIDLCVRCYGFWLDSGESASWGNLTQDIPDFEIVSETVATHQWKCPKCESWLQEMKFSHTDNLFIDCCTSCHGIWFDRNEISEFERIVKRYRQEGSASFIAGSPAASVQSGTKEDTSWMPRASWEIVRDSVWLYEKNFVSFFIISFLPTLMMMFVEFIFLNKNLKPFGKTVQESKTMVFLFLLFLEVFFSQFGIAALTYAVAQRYLGQNISICKAYRIALAKIISLLGVNVCIGFILLATLGLSGMLSKAFSHVLRWHGISLLSVLWLVTGAGLLLWFILRWILTSQIIVLEEKRALEAMKRSEKLTEKHRLHALKFLILLIFVLTFAPFTIGLVTQSFQIHPLLNEIGSLILQGIVQPLAFVALVLFYYDLRLRKEDFDLEEMFRINPAG